MRAPLRPLAADASPSPRARNMRVVATGLLVAMAALYAVSRLLERHAPAWGFARAFAEAAMVGGLADWFAVTALFRHPLGLPVPHTAIIPRNKDRIGDNLALFLRTNFLLPALVARRMARLDLAGAAGRVLAAPPREGALRAGVGRLAATALESLDDERLGQMFKMAAAERLRGVPVAPLAGQLLAAAIAEGRHRPMLDGAIQWAGRALEANEALFRQMIAERAGSILRWTGLDTTIANKILDGLFKLLADMGEDADHPLRRQAETAMEELAARLSHDPVLQAKVAAWRDATLANPAVGRWLDGLWQQARSALLRVARDPEAAARGRLGALLRQLGHALQHEPALQLAVNRFARRAVAGIVASYGAGIVKLVSETIRGWDAGTITARLETAVGRDLQYIRVNGTLVGGLVGLGLHLFDVLA